MTYNELVDEELLKEAQEELPDIILSHKKIDSNTAYKTPVQDVQWWYVVGEPGGIDNAGDPYNGYKDGVAISILTKNRYYDITLSIEVIRDMYATILERTIADANENAGISVEGSIIYKDTSYRDAVYADNPVGYWSFDEKELEEVE